MNCLRLLRNLVLRFDLFAASPTLRVNGETDYEHVCCGSFSIVLIFAFIGIFAQQIINVLNKAQIQASVNIDDQVDGDAKTISDIRFALGIEKVRIDEIPPYFGVQLLKVERVPEEPQPIQTEIQLQFCTQDVWSSYGDKFDIYFKAYQIKEMLCIPSSVNLSLEGYEGSDTQTSLELRINKCKGPECANDSELSQYMETHLNENDYFRVRLLFVDTIISPSDANVAKKALQKDVFLTFSSSMGSRGQITLGRYEVTTDESIWPFEIENVTEGHYIETFQTNTIEIRSDHYVLLEITKSTLVYTVERFHKKIDDLLSYIGGLFALVFVVFFFFMAPFNQYRYELMVAENSFSYDENGKKIREKDLSIWLYIKYAFYDMCKMVGCELDWEDMKRIDEAREEANSQLDVKTIMKKLRHFERFSSLIMDEYMLVCSQLMKPLTIEQSRKKRKILQYYDKIMKNKLSDEQFNTTFDILGMSTKMTHTKLPIEEARKRLDSETQLMDQKTIKNKSVDEKLQKSEKKCCLIDDQFDSQDEEVEKYIYEMFTSMKRNESRTAELIERKIPKYIKMRMNNKIKFVEEMKEMHFVTLQ